jgi:hypothetical protein
LTKLAEVRSTSEAGRLLESVLEHDYAVSTLKVGWDEIPAEMVKGIQVLKEERDKHYADEMEKIRTRNQTG